MLIFEGRFTLEEIEEIKEKVDFQEEDFLVASMPKSFNDEDETIFEESELVLSNEKTVYLYEGDLSLDEAITYRRFTAKQLKTLFVSFMEKRYGYVPDFEVQLDTFIWLPVEVEFFEEDLELIENFEDEDFDELNEEQQAFKAFWGKFEHDMASVKDKHNGDDFEYGDKLLQLIFGKETVSYEIVGADEGDDVIFTEEDDEGAVIIGINESKPISLLSDNEIKKELSRVQPEEVLEAIVYGKDIDELRYYVQNYDLTVPVVAGMCAIHVAADAGKLEKLKVIIEAGCDVNLPDLGYGYTALGYAAGKKDLEVVKYLLENGANAHVINRQGGTALAEAKSEAMRALIQKYL